MKKFNEIYAEALKNEELRNELTQAVSERKITEFLKAHDCDSDTEEIIEFLTEQQAKTQRGDIELNIDDLEDVAGGSNRFVAILLPLRLPQQKITAFRQSMYLMLNRKKTT